MFCMTLALAIIAPATVASTTFALWAMRWMLRRGRLSSSMGSPRSASFNSSCHARPDDAVKLAAKV